MEAYFGHSIGTRVLSSYYYIGLGRDYRAVNSLYTWVDGTQIGNGYVSNAGGCPAALMGGPPTSRSVSDAAGCRTSAVTGAVSNTAAHCNPQIPTPTLAGTTRTWWAQAPPGTAPSRTSATAMTCSWVGGSPSSFIRPPHSPCATLSCSGTSNCTAAAGEEGNYVQQQMWQNYMRSVEANNK